MPKENKGQAARDYGSRKKRIKRIRNTIIVILLIALAAGGALYLYTLNNKNYSGYEVLNSTDNKVDSAAAYLSYGSAIIKYSKDGAQAINKDGKLLWNGSYQMNKPIADTSGKYAVIADQGGHSIRLFNDKGAVGSITTVYDIVKIKVASQGVVAALMEAEDTNYITLYDVDGTVLMEMATNTLEDGYPIDMDLSEDGQKLVTDYLSINSGKLVGVVTFYNFGEVGQNWTDGIMGAFKFEGIVVPRVAFNNNDTVTAFKENGFMTFEYKEQPALLIEQKYEEEKIHSVLYNDKYTGVVMEKGEDGYSKLLLYDLLGKTVLEKRLDFDYNRIELYDEEIMMHDNASCIILKPDGRMKFNYTFETGVTAFYPINGVDRYFLIGDTKISQIGLVE